MPDDHETPETLGERLHQFAQQLYPIHRAITGAGVRQTLNEIARHIPLQQHAVLTGTPVLDWIVPDEWVVRDGFIALDHSAGNSNSPAERITERIIDYRNSNLHVPNYSEAVDRKMRLSELMSYLHTLPEHPDWIPFRAFHFQKKWGFCLSQNDLEILKHWKGESDPVFHVRIDAEHLPGELNYGELLIPGESNDEFLISTHVCHPSLANDNLSGIVIATELARRLIERQPLPISVRFLFIPCTIGSITWLAKHKDKMPSIRGGLVLSNLGDAGSFNYKKSRLSGSRINRIAEQILAESLHVWNARPFNPWGYDERQYCSPGFNLPIGRLTRSSDGEFPEYHTSADNLSFIKPVALAESLELVWRIIVKFASKCHSTSSDFGSEVFESACDQEIDNHRQQPCDHNWQQHAHRRWLNTKPYGEPRLGQYDLYQGYGAQNNKELQKAVLWMLNLSDGHFSFSEIINHSRLEPAWLMTAAEKLTQCGLLKQLP